MTKPPDVSSTIPVSVAEWVAVLGAWAQSKGWGRNRRSILERLALVHTEVSEIVFALRHGAPPTQILTKPDGAPEGVPIEIADAVMRLMVLCAEEGIDLEQAMTLKLAYNRTRPDRHGERPF